MRLARDFVLYNLVALSSAAADWLAFLGLEASGAGHLSAQVGARIAGGLLSFFANKRSMEKGAGGRVLVQGRRFLLLYVVSLALSVGLLYAQVDLLGWSLYGAKLVADGACFLVNFAVMRGYVFRATAGLTHRLRVTMGGPPAIEGPRSEPDGRGRLGIPGPLLPWIAVFGLAIAAGIAARFLLLDHVVYEIWADRDLSRAEELFRQPLFTGAEFDRGGRTPGGFYYLLLRTYLLLGPSPTQVQVGTVALDVVALVTLGAVLRRRLGWTAGLAGAAFYACSPAALDHLGFGAYNPTNAMAFGVLAHAFFLEALLGGRRGALPVAFFFVALAAQIHFSYALLLPLFALVLAVQRARIGGRVWAAALLAFTIPWVPYLVADGAAGWPNLREIGARQDILAAPAVLALIRGGPPQIQPRLESLSTLLLAFPIPTAKVWLHLGPITIHGIALWRLFPVLLVAAYVIHLAWTWRRPAATPGASANRHAASAALTIIGAGLLLLSIRNTSLVIRYVLFLLPSAATIFGCAFHAYGDALAGTPRGWPKTLLNVMLLGMAALFTVAGPLGYAIMPSPLLPSHLWQRLIGELQREIGFGPRDILERVVLVDATREQLILVGPTTAAGAYMVRAFADRRPDDAQGRCALVLIGNEFGPPVTAARIPEALALLPGQPAPTDVRAAPSGSDVTIVSYRLDSGSCYHNLNDRYVLTPEEKVIAEEAPTVGSVASNAVKEIATKDTRRFLLTLPSRNPWLGPLRLMVEIVAKDGVLWAVLHSNELRGYDGLSSYRARGTALVLHGDGREWRIPIYEGTLGGWFTAALTPWRSAAVPIPAGAYRADLVIDDVAFLESGGSEGARRVPLTPALMVPAPRGPSPEASAPGQPGGGQGSRGTPPRAGTGTPPRAPR